MDNFLDLKLGKIEQYSMIVPYTELTFWQKLGWKTCDEVGRPREIAQEADLLYGEIGTDETLIFNRPALLKNISPEKIKGLKIKEICPWLGTYGMGGAGFLGFLLENDEYLTYAVFRTGSYIFADGQIIEPFHINDKTKSWCGHNDDLTALTEHLVNSQIEDFTFTKDRFTLRLKNSTRTIKVEFVKNGLTENAAYETGEIADYIVLQHQNATLIV